MTTVALDVRPDADDPRALQAWVDTVADGVAVRMLLDTGSSRTSVPHVGTFAAATRTPTDPGYGTSGTASADPLIRLDRLVAGDRVVDGLVVSLQPEGWPHPPLLGTDVLMPGACRFEFSRGRLIMDTTPSESVGEWHAWGASSTPGVELRWGSTAVMAVWDTGAGITIVDRSWAEAHPEAVSIGTADRHGTDVTGTAVPATSGTIAACTIGGRSFPAAHCGVVDLSALNARLSTPLVMIVGLPQISRADWQLDFDRRRWSYA